MNKFVRILSSNALVRKHEVLIMYFGRASEFLMTTSECLPVPEGSCTVQQILEQLRGRGARWAKELDTSHVICEIDRQPVPFSGIVRPGVELSIFSKKGYFEP